MGKFIEFDLELNNNCSLIDTNRLRAVGYQIPVGCRLIVVSLRLHTAQLAHSDTYRRRCQWVRGGMMPYALHHVGCTVYVRPQFPTSTLQLLRTLCSKPSPTKPDYLSSSPSPHPPVLAFVRIHIDPSSCRVRGL